MKKFPDDVRFSGTWRKYQQSVLDQFQDFISDRHLHIIAPPGSGKTVLGLEAALRINKPTLILTPTLAIRNQWIQRFCDLFLQQRPCPGWISTDIRSPGFMTVVTYQGLHAACSSLKTDDDDPNGKLQHPDHHSFDHILNGLKKHEVGTIVVDEAHHLRNDWWKTLIMLKQSLQPYNLSLTATPPYDVPAQEWQRYMEFNGPVDMEISVPELVMEGDLCVHQDYVYLSFPDERARQTIAALRNDIAHAFQQLKTDQVLIENIERLPLWDQPSAHLEWIYKNLTSYAAMLIFLHAAGRDISVQHLQIIGGGASEVPAFDYRWAEQLLRFYLFDSMAELPEIKKDHRRQLEQSLKKAGIIDHQRISFIQNEQIDRLLTTSAGKLKSIKQIADFEFSSLGQALRMVILTDHIRKEYYVSSTENVTALNKIGALSIFEHLRRSNAEGAKIGVLTGSIVIIPAESYTKLQYIAGHSAGGLQCSVVPFDHQYLLVEQRNENKHLMVQSITELFQSGGIEILIGTKALLGEGWDAPAINTIVLASFVGSFVLSNQMRGRAIRTQHGNVHKSGNIWHLACIDPSSKTGGRDYQLLRRRFHTFVGISMDKSGSIENGIGRLQLPAQCSSAHDLEVQNKKMLSAAADRDNLKEQWELALQGGTTMVEQLKMPYRSKRAYRETKALHLKNTISNLIITLCAGLATFLEIYLDILLKLLRNNGISYVYPVSIGFGILAILMYGRRTLKALSLYLKYKDISKDIHQIGCALLDTLVHLRIIKTDQLSLSVNTAFDQTGAVYCHLEGGSTYEKSIFINALTEITGPIDNPRYIMIRKSRLFSFIHQKDYHTVPELISRNKRSAIFFAERWRYYTGACELVYTRTVQGRNLLLRSRFTALISNFSNQSQKISKWER